MRITSEPFYKGHTPHHTRNKSHETQGRNKQIKMGNCYSSVTVTDEFILDTLVKVYEREKRLRAFLLQWLQQGATNPLPHEVLQDVAYWVGTRFALGDLMGKGGSGTRVEKIYNDLKTLDFGGIPNDALISVLTGIDQDNFVPQFGDKPGTFETSTLYASLYGSGLQHWLNQQEAQVDQEIKQQKERDQATPGASNTDTMVRLEMEKELYKKAAKTATTMFTTNYMKVFHLGTKNFKYDDYGTHELRAFQPIPSSLPGQIYKEAVQRLQKASEDQPLAYVWRTLIQTLNFSQPVNLADNDYRKVWANPPYGAMLKLLSEKVVYEWCSDAVEQKKPVVQRAFAVFDALRAIAVQVVSHHNFLQQVLRSQQAESQTPKEWDSEQKERLIAYFNAENDPFYSLQVAQNVTVMQRILSFLA